MPSNIPRAANWVLARKNRDGSYRLYHCLTGRRYTLGPRLGYLWRRLDGKTPPCRILPECTPRQLRAMLRTLDGAQLLRRSRVVSWGPGSIACSLVIPRHHTTRSRLPGIANGLLLGLWCPVLILGLWALCHTRLQLHFSGLLWGQPAGLVLGSVCHELAHGVSALAYGAPFLEAGVCLQWGMPGAYVLLDIGRTRPLAAAQIFASGAQANFLLGGIGLCLAAWVPQAYGFFFGFALNNLLQGLVNLLPLPSLDGMQILEALRG